jgi:octanoyl-[GcvH]:protein N-octanoyltransferase
MRFTTVQLLSVGTWFLIRDYRLDELHPGSPERPGHVVGYAARVAPHLDLIQEGFAIDAGLDTATSRALLIKASAGEVGETFRLSLPGKVVAFGKRDRSSSGYRSAVRVARDMGFEAVERLAGGRAAVFHEGALAFSWTIPAEDPRSGIRARFEELSSLMVRSFTSLGVDAAVGELPGEYCPGAFSVHGAGRLKLMGVGQRLAKNAAHIGGVVVVSQSELLREVLVPIYEALELPWDPRTAGALQDLVAAVTLKETTDSILAELSRIREMTPTSIDADTRQLAAGLAPEHLAA